MVHQIQGDVKELRPNLAPNIATITIPPATQTLNTVQGQSNHLEIARELKRKLSSPRDVSGAFEADSAQYCNCTGWLEAGQTGLATDQDLKGDDTHNLHLRGQETTLVNIREDAITINTHTRETHAVVSAIHKGVPERKRQRTLF